LTTLTPTDRLWRGFDRAGLDHQYDARATVADYEAEARAYAEDSVAAMTTLDRRADLVFDPASGSALDLYPAAGPGPHPVFVWVHGGYWRALSKQENAFVAPALVAAGISVAVIDYTLAPAAALEEITRQTRAAVGWIHHNAAAQGLDANRIFVGGSSAGGHLTGMLLAADGWRAEAGLPQGVIKGAVSLSGLYDLEPVRLGRVNDWLGLDAPRARRLSPLHLLPTDPAEGCPLIVSYGGSETAEFKRQTDDYLAAWTGHGHPGRFVAMEDCNHFDIARRLGTHGTPLAEAAIRLICGT
jgi:arylformamidase